MKTLGRIIIILAVFAVAMGITYAAVTSSTASSTNMPQFENGERPSLSSGQFEPGERPERHEEDGGGLMFGMIKNVGIIAILVAIIVVPKNLNKRKRLQASLSTDM